MVLSEPIIKIIKDKNFAFLGTIMRDGRPQVSPIWIDIDDDNNIILINTAQGRIKQKIFQEILEYLYPLLIKIIHIVW